MDKYLIDNINELYQIDTNDLNKNILYQINELNSSDYNLTLETISTHINQLYDKMRILEDTNAFIKKQTELHISSISSECETLLKEIEVSRDSLKNLGYSTLNVPLIHLGDHADRDGSLLKPVSYIGEGFTLHRNLIEDAKIQKAVRTSKLTPLNDTLGTFKDDPYRVCYVSDTAYESGIFETIKLFFDKPIGLSLFTIKPSRCDLFDKKSCFNNQLTTLSSTCFMPSLLTDSFVIILSSKKFELKKYTYDASRMQPDAFEKIAQEEYLKMTGNQKSNLTDFDSLLGISQYKTDYANYLSLVNAWKAKRQQIIDTNKQNGYTSDFPIYEPIVSPLKINSNLTEIQPFVNPNSKMDNSILTSNGVSYPIYQNTEKDIYPNFERYRYEAQHYESSV